MAIKILRRVRVVLHAIDATRKWIIEGRRVEPSRRLIVEICVTLRALGVVRFAKGLWAPKKRSNCARASSIENFSPGSHLCPKNGASKALLKPVHW